MTVNLYALTEARPGHPDFGRPFYIGIGTARRPRKHFDQARSKRGHRNARLHAIIAAHIVLKIEPGISIIGIFDTKADAGEAEKAAIAMHGRIGIEAGGILCNLASGGQGPDSELMRLPEVRARNAEAQRNVSPEAKAARIAALAANRANPETERRRRENSSAPQKASWADPKTRAKRVAGMKGTKKTPSAAALAARQANAAKAQTPEAKAKRSAELKARWADPAYKARLAEKRRQAWQDPEMRAKMLAGRSEGVAKSWEDPATRARRIDGIKAASVDPVEREAGHGEDGSD